MVEQSEYIFRRFNRGVLAFAVVSLTLSRSTDGNTTIKDISDLFMPDTEVKERPTQDMLSAVVRGLEKTISSLHRLGRLSEGLNITITRTAWHWPDSTPDAFECAAGLALCRCLFPGEPEPELEFDERWRLRIWG